MNIFKKKKVRGYAVAGSIWFIILSIILSIGVLSWWKAMLIALFLVPIFAIAIVLIRSLFFVLGVTLVMLVEYLDDWIDNGE